jgi:glutamate N-acetyltransferase/amino-acid N-acetyltransferase
VSVTHPAGFTASGVSAGLKSTGALDLALVVNQGPTFDSATVFTANRCKANPVLWSQEVVKDGVVRAVVLNSGGANCYTGPEGFQTTHAVAERVATGVGAGAIDVVVCSTGLIGLTNSREKLLDGVDRAVAGLGAHGDDAARAIMTTDTVPKTTVQSRDGWTVGGMAKGAGMLAPSLATMLVVLTTDAAVDGETLQAALKAATSVSVERVDSDGCLSTNDTVIVLASGASGVTPTPAELTEALTAAATDLAMQLLADAEGSTKDIAITVRGAASVADALTAGRACARNNLLKTALFGNDPNWGRVLAAIGTTDAAFEAERVDVSINGVMVCRGGSIGDPREGVDLTGREIAIEVDLKAGEEQATIWTNDLSIAYVHENSAYST